jgi:hypothetical protein
LFALLKGFLNLAGIGDIHSDVYINYILSHEYTHALQDQNFDLDTYYPIGSYDGDLARLSAVEGDAVMTMEKWADLNLNTYERTLIEIESIAQILTTVDSSSEGYYSEILAEIAYFPYDEGHDFVREIYDIGGWEAVNDLYTDRPPLSTEHILHADKYLAYEPPLDIDFSGNTTGFDLVFSTVVGEKMLMEVLDSSYMTSSWGNARGWGGDTFYHYASENDFLSVLCTRWDSEGDAQQFYKDYESLLLDEGFKRGDGQFNVHGDHAYLEMDGDMVTIYSTDSLEVLNRFMP